MERNLKLVVVPLMMAQAVIAQATQAPPLQHTLSQLSQQVLRLQQNQHALPINSVHQQVSNTFIRREK